MTETTQLGLPIYSDNDVPLWTNTNDGFEALDSLVNSCSSVKLNWSTPLHKFTAGNLTYTATKDCWLVGNHGQTAVGTLSINGNIITQANSGLAYFIPPLPLRKGDVVTVQAAESQLYVLEGELVSGNTYVFNEAQVTLDYAHPLFTFGTNNLSYTATKKCYLVGLIPGVWDSNVTLSIDGTVISQATYSNSVGQGKEIPILTIEKGSTVSLNRWAGSVDCLHIFDGTVSGSVSDAIGGLPNIDYDNPLHSGDNTTYTATSECYAMAGVCGGTITLNGTVIAKAFVAGNASYSTTSIPLLKLKSGDTIVTQGDARGTYMAIFPPL